MAYRRSRRARGSRRSRISRRRSSRRFSKKARPSSRFATRFRRSKKAPRITTKRFTDIYPDVFMTKMKDHFMDTYSPTRLTLNPTEVITNVATARNSASIIMNANPNSGPFIFDNVVSDTFEPNPSDMLKQRYLVYRPMGAKITVTAQAKDPNDSLGAGSSPQAYLVGFPYVIDSSSLDASTTQADAALSNYWDQTGALALSPENVPQLKYGWRRLLSGKGGKSSVTFSKYYSFAKLLGLTNEQYMAIAALDTSTAINGSAMNVTCSTSSSNNPRTSIRLCIAVADFVSDFSSEWTYQVKMTQYGRWETVKMLTQ